MSINYSIRKGFIEQSYIPNKSKYTYASFFADFKLGRKSTYLKYKCRNFVITDNHKHMICEYNQNGTITFIFYLEHLNLYKKFGLKEYKSGYFINNTQIIFHSKQPMKITTPYYETKK